MPSPIDVLLRVHASPVPIQTVFEFLGSMVTAPMDCTGCLSKTGLYVVPPFCDFHTPPLAAPTYTVNRGPSHTASRAAMRPLIVAEPMLRAPRPEIVSESTLTGAWAIAAAANRMLRMQAAFFIIAPPGPSSGLRPPSRARSLAPRSGERVPRRGG